MYPDDANVQKKKSNADSLAALLLEPAVEEKRVQYEVDDFVTILLTTALDLYKSEFCMRNPPAAMGKTTTTLYLDRITKGYCCQCKATHERDNIKALITAIPEKSSTRNSPKVHSTSKHYRLAYVCMRYSKNTTFRYKNAGKLTLDNNVWSIER